MSRFRGKPLRTGWPVMGLVALLAALTLAGCADFYRMAGLDPRLESSDDKAGQTAEDNERREKQLQELTQKIREMSETIDRMSKTVAALSEKLATQDPDARQARARRPGSGVRGEGNAECAWIGQRTISVLLNDDLIAAEGFTRLYGDFQCPMEHLGLAFACAAAGVQQQQKDRATLDVNPAAPKPGETTEQAAASRREAQLAAADRREKRISACWKQPKGE